jgi:hypothetical protein
MNASEPFVDISSLSSFLDSIGSHHIDLIFTPQNMLKQGTLLLYHCTDLAGLLGIVKDHDLWLAHLQYSNDAEEMIHGITVIRKVIDQAVLAKIHDASYLQELVRLTSEPGRGRMASHLHSCARHPGAAQFRVSSHMLVPYYSWRSLIGTNTLPLLPLRQVCVGPSGHKQLNAESAKALLVALR